MIRFLEKYVMPVAGKVAEQRHLLAIRDGLVLTMPFLIGRGLWGIQLVQLLI